MLDSTLSGAVLLPVVLCHARTGLEWWLPRQVAAGGSSSSAQGTARPHSSVLAGAQKVGAHPRIKCTTFHNPVTGHLGQTQLCSCNFLRADEELQRHRATPRTTQHCAPDRLH